MNRTSRSSRKGAQAGTMQIETTDKTRMDPDSSENPKRAFAGSCDLSQANLFGREGENGRAFKLLARPQMALR